MISRLNNIHTVLHIQCWPGWDWCWSWCWGTWARWRVEPASSPCFSPPLCYPFNQSIRTLSTLTKNKIYLCRKYSNKMEFSDFWAVIVLDWFAFPVHEAAWHRTIQQREPFWNKYNVLETLPQNESFWNNYNVLETLPQNESFWNKYNV